MTNKKQGMSSQAKRRMIILAPLCLLCIVAFTYSVFSFAYDVYQLQQQKNTLDAEYTVLQQTAERLRIDIIKLQDIEYIARFAREQYLYSRDGELILRINESILEEEQAQTVESEANDRMIIYASIGGLLLIFVYITIKGVKKEII